MVVMSNEAAVNPLRNTTSRIGDVAVVLPSALPDWASARGSTLATDDGDDDGDS